ncbi:MAG: class I SAM-dependent methyltransferase [Solirubrobacteraceae bacterium]
MNATLAAPPGVAQVPEFRRGWLVGDTPPEPYLSYATGDVSVNWSDELEQLHEESSRNHFMDVWTRRAIVERLGEPAADATLLDLGCSTGYLLEDLRRRHPSGTLWGLDLIGAGLRKAHERVPEARLLRADACELPFAAGSVDAICSANLLEHVPDDRRALQEIARVLRPGGRAVIVVPAGPATYDYYDRFLGHERRYGRHELSGKAREAGLQTIEDCYLGSIIYPPFWLVKQRNRRRFGALYGDALEQRVAADIAATRDSAAGRRACGLERRLLDRRVRLPFGIRNLVVLGSC